MIKMHYAKCVMLHERNFCINLFFKLCGAMPRQSDYKPR